MARVHELRIRNGQVLKCTSVVTGKTGEPYVKYKRLSRPNGEGGELEQRRWDKLKLAGMLRSEMEGTLSEQNLRLADALDELTARIEHIEHNLRHEEII